MVPKDRCGKVQLAIIDAIGPFFRNLDQRRINWSKIPFADLPVTGDDALKFWSEIRLDFERFAEKARHLGFNAVTLDDVAHLVPHPDYEPELRERTAFFCGTVSLLDKPAPGLWLQSICNLRLPVTPTVNRPEDRFRQSHGTQIFRRTAQIIFPRFPGS